MRSITHKDVLGEPSLAWSDGKSLPATSRKAGVLDAVKDILLPNSWLVKTRIMTIHRVQLLGNIP
jgi:hypothetical protein